ncbi:homocysteine S-methyltransferase family protein [Paludisphaera sp.]|uniref:homocysteine S-methyltransferase family protein n=1 Tax=Paludisphaera sp. TaxID=2017432 RepID=UPI00301B7580
MTRLRDRRPTTILDGGWATELQRRGLALGEPADAWNLSRPDDVLAVARSYVEAGAGIILTNTFQASPIALARFGLADRAQGINQEGARLSRLAVSSRGVRVFGSVGPTGLGRELAAGSTEAASRASEAFSTQARALAEGGVDAIALETFCHVGEARLAARAALAAGLPVVASFYFDTATGRPLTPDGSTPEDVARAMAEEGVDAVGANCGAGPAEFVEICRRLRAADGRGVWIKPNAGLPTIAGGRAVYPTTPAGFAAFLPAFIEAGAAFVGGCCGASPEFVRALKRAADQEVP